MKLISMLSKNKFTAVVLALSTASLRVMAQEQPFEFEEILITGGREGITSTSGSATYLDENDILEFDITDINDILASVPGVYIRQEDGFGLRPNIGIRGATSERSQKITLMEDGILISPAPYAAPAAYYIPNVNRMSAIEVFKGPASIAYGPHTVGGAINLATPSVDQNNFGFLDFSSGSYGFNKARVYYNQYFDGQGFWIDAMRYGADGFKELDSGGDTGFIRNDLNLKWQAQQSLHDNLSQEFTIKVGYADEVSDETYLGLIDSDFYANPNRRYAASELDRFESKHSQVHGFYRLDADVWNIELVSYVNRFDRSWNKFDGFLPLEFEQDSDPYKQRVAAADVFAASTPIVFLDLVRGNLDSDGSLAQTLDITDNNRRYGSQGMKFKGEYEISLGSAEHKFESGIGYHQDYVDRDHSVKGYWMQAGRLVNDGVDDYPNKALNRAEAEAIWIYLKDQISLEKWIFNIGLRNESISGNYFDYLSGSEQSRSESIVIPGAGVYYAMTDDIGLLAGVNRGFSPNAPNAASDVEPEVSVNYEYGLRISKPAFAIDLIGFFSDYKNLIGRCRVSDPSCEAGEEFNGLNVEIAGLELNMNSTIELSTRVSMPVGFVYTYSESAFQNNFESNFSQWGNVTKGDELPYLPNHQGKLNLGLDYGLWQAHLVLNYVGKMREQAGQGESDGSTTKSQVTLDLSGHYSLNDNLDLRLVINNLNNTQEIVSRRPFGARPNSPRAINFGIKYEF